MVNTMEKDDCLDILDKIETESKRPEIPIFQSVQKNFAYLGISSDLLHQKYLFNRRILFGCLIFCSALISVGTCITFEADTFWEFSQCAFFGSILVSGILALLFLTFRVPRLFKLIASFEHVIDTSERIRKMSVQFHLLIFIEIEYSKKFSTALEYYPTTEKLIIQINQLAEKSCEISFFVLVKMGIGCSTSPWFIYAYIAYFTTNLGSDAFELPYQLWY